MSWQPRLAAGIALASWLGACATPGVPAERGTARAVDGVEIAYDVRGTGEPALVFVHGWACDRTHWREQAAAFSRDHRVVTLDLAGHGQSGTNRELWNPSVLGDDVRAVADALELQRMVLIGHSMGGPVCLEAAARMPGRVVAVVGVDSLHDADARIPPELFASILSAFESDYEGTMAAAIRSMCAPATPESLVTRLVEGALRSPRGPPLALFRAFPDFDPKTSLAGAGVPVRCINAAPLSPQAPRTSIEHNRVYADFDALEIEGVGHWLMLERPDEFGARLRQVLAELEPGSAP